MAQQSKVVVTAVLLQALGAPPVFASPLHADAPFLRDEAGRVVFLHGVNAVWKTPPYYPPSTVYSSGAVSPAESYFDDRDAQFLADNGLGSVRLGCLWAGEEPAKDLPSPDYLKRVEELVDMLGAKGVKVLVDFHQDMYNERFGGEGFPDWAVVDDGIPATKCCGFPGNYFADPATMHVFDSLWLDRNGLWSDFRDFWKRVAARFSAKPNVIGYDLMNEPWAGTQWPTCLNPLGCPAFDVLRLQPFFEHAIEGVRSVDDEKIVFWEPQTISSGSAGNSVGLLRPLRDDGANTGLSFHGYCLSTLFGSGAPPIPDPTCSFLAGQTFTKEKAAAITNGSAPVLSEFGASDDLAYIGLFASLADQHMVSWFYWHYGSWFDPTGAPGAEGLFTDDLDRPGSLKPAKADVLIRTYPQAVAGLPQSFSFDPDTKDFTLVYQADPSVAAPTEIFVPVARHYPGGYDVTASGPAVVTSAANATLLTLTNTGEGLVTVVVKKH